MKSEDQIQKPTQKDMDKLYRSVCKVIEQARSFVSVAANTAIVQQNWEIGRLIVEDEQGGKRKAEYGKAQIKGLADRLTVKYGRGYTLTNLKYMRQFYLAFPIGHALRGELSWTHYRLLLRVEDEKARTFYLNEAAENGWSSRQLERQINTFYYQRLLASHNKDLVKHKAEKNNEQISPSKLLKDPYVLEFLDIKENSDFLEADLEKGLINKLQDFLLELGKGFAFVARQQRITTEAGKHYYVDLVLYNYILKCFVLIDLKTGTLTPQDVGQMDMYVRLYEKQKRTETDNPTIGIILCSQNDKTVVEYSMLSESKQLFSSQYKLYMPTDDDLRNLLQNQ